MAASRKGHGQVLDRHVPLSALLRKKVRVPPPRQLSTVQYSSRWGGGVDLMLKISRFSKDLKNFIFRFGCLRLLGFFDYFSFLFLQEF